MSVNNKECESETVDEKSLVSHRGQVKTYGRSRGRSRGRPPGIAKSTRAVSIDSNLLYTLHQGME